MFFSLVAIDSVMFFQTISVCPQCSDIFSKNNKHSKDSAEEFASLKEELRNVHQDLKYMHEKF